MNVIVPLQLVNRKVSVVSSSSSSGEGGEVVALANGPRGAAPEPQQQVVVQSSPDSTSNVNDQVSLRFASQMSEEFL
jgi:hypothetical protein